MLTGGDKDFYPVNTIKLTLPDLMDEIKDTNLVIIQIGNLPLPPGGFMPVVCWEMVCRDCCCRPSLFTVLSRFCLFSSIHVLYLAFQFPCFSPIVIYPRNCYNRQTLFRLFLPRLPLLEMCPYSVLYGKDMMSLVVDNHAGYVAIIEVIL